MNPDTWIMTDDDHAEAGHYQCPDCGEWHDGRTTGTEWCEDHDDQREG